MITRTEKEVGSTIAILNQRLQEAGMELPANKEVKAGYTEAVRVLTECDEHLERIAANCHSVQARCIAWLAVDYLHGECSQRVLCEIPLKEGKQ